MGSQQSTYRTTYLEIIKQTQTTLTESSEPTSKLMYILFVKMLC